MIARGGPGVGANAEAFLANLEIGFRANDVHQEKILPSLLVIDVAEIAAEIEAVEMVNAGDVARANSENGALGFAVIRLNAKVAVAFLCLQKPFDRRQHKTFRRIMRIGRVNLNLVAILRRHGVKAGVATATAERRENFVSPAPKAGPRFSTPRREQPYEPSCDLLLHPNGHALKSVFG